MSVVPVDPRDPDPRAIERAAGVLRSGGLVAFPTETVYGLGAHALDTAAVARIFAAKGRPSFNPLIVHVAEVAAVQQLVARWPEAAQRLADAFWPGPLTLVLPKRAAVPDAVTAGLGTVAVRVPAHPVAIALLRSCGLPTAAPSANRYTEVSPTTALHVVKSLGDRVDLVLDGGPTDVGIESSVVDLSGTRPRLLRPGTIDRSRIEAVVGPLEAAVQPLQADAARPGPGMVRRHYAPRARLRLFPPGERQQMDEAARIAAANGLRTGALTIAAAPPGVDHPLRMPGSPPAYAARLYAALHELDDLGCELILVERVPGSPEWAGLRDRLDRAAEER